MVAGNQFYTGYAINVTHRSMHGVLTQDLERFARRGVAYRDHMAHELIRHLIGELVRSGHFEEAKSTAAMLENVEHVRRCQQFIAISQLDTAK